MLGNGQVKVIAEISSHINANRLRMINNVLNSWYFLLSISVGYKWFAGKSTNSK